MPKDKHLGELDAAAASEVAREAENKEKTKDEIRVEKALRERPALNRILSLQDMEDVARKVLPYKALAYYSSASDDEISASLKAFSSRHTDELSSST